MSMVGGMGRGGFYHLQDRVSLTPAERGRRGQEEVGGQRPAEPPDARRQTPLISPGNEWGAIRRPGCPMVCTHGGGYTGAAAPTHTVKACMNW